MREEVVIPHLIGGADRRRAETRDGTETEGEGCSVTAIVEELPKVLRGIAPAVGSVWEWEPLSPHARDTVTVTRVHWNGEECWVESRNSKGKLCWNELDRWVEATVLIETPE